MQLIKIQKKSGAYRTVCAPDVELKAKLRALVGQIEAKARKACPPQVLHGFARGRSPITNALAHVGRKYTLCFDLEDFFDSVGARQLKGKLSAKELADVLVDPADGLGLRAVQGLPTSPAVANIAASDLDKAILRTIDKAKHRIVYTRYADDLTFSFDDSTIRHWLLCEIPQIVGRCGFRINARKTRFMPASAGRRVITGVAVDDAGIHATRSVRRRLRAAQHQAAYGRSAEIRAAAASSARGLTEWSQLKSPMPAEERARQISICDTAERLAKAWRLGKLPRIPESAVPDVVEADYIITRDPAYILGMSTYTTGWSSCMRQPGGQYRRGVKLWLGLAGTSIAALLSERTATHAGVERRVMRARCLLHHFRDGSMAYDRVYGDVQSIQQLQEWLEARGCVPVSKIPSGTRVIGNVSRKRVRTPYFDNLRAREMTDAGRPVWVVQK